MTVVAVPPRFETEHLGDFCADLDKTLSTDDVSIDFSPLSYSKPIAMMIAGSKLRRWALHRQSSGLRSLVVGVDLNKSVHSYLDHIGFFEYILMGGVNPIGAARGSSSYVPITRVTRPAFDPSEHSLHQWYEMVEIEASKLAALVGRNRPSLVEPFRFALRELLRNVFEHARVSECYFCGQSWYDGRVEVCIVDEGVGISQTLKEAYPIMSDGQALEMATKPGVSRVTSQPESRNFYDNSGFGLYVLSEAGAKYGAAALGSGDSVYNCWGDQREVTPFAFSGTFFGMVINQPVHDFEEELKRIVARGEQLAAEAGRNVHASGASKSTRIT